MCLMNKSRTKGEDWSTAKSVKPSVISLLAVPKRYFCLILLGYCTARQCSPLRRKFMECSINSPALSLLMKHLVIGQRLKIPNCSAFHWSSRGSLVSIGQHFVATRVVHLPKSTETSLITESDQSGPNHQLLQVCTARTAWSDRTRLRGPCIAAIIKTPCGKRQSNT